MARIRFYGTNPNSARKNARITVGYCELQITAPYTIKLQMIQITNFECFYRISFGWVSFQRKKSAVLSILLVAISLLSFLSVSFTTSVHSFEFVRIHGWLVVPKENFFVCCFEFPMSFFLLLFLSLFSSLSLGRKMFVQFIFTSESKSFRMGKTTTTIEQHKLEHDTVMSYTVLYCIEFQSAIVFYGHTVHCVCVCVPHMCMYAECMDILLSLFLFLCTKTFHTFFFFQQLVCILTY